MTSVLSDNNKINELMDSTKCWICLNPLFVPAIIKCNNEDHSSMTNICACLSCCRRALKLNKRKSERNGNLRLPCGCIINLSTPIGVRNTHMYKKVETMFPILNCLYQEVECSNGCGFKAKSQKSAYKHLRKDCPISHVKCIMCNFWGERKDILKHRIEKHPINVDFTEHVMPITGIFIKDFEKYFLGSIVDLISYPSFVRESLDFDVELLKNISNVTINMEDGKKIIMDPKRKNDELELDKKDIHQKINTNYFT
jgi:hypothetical protein